MKYQYVVPKFGLNERLDDCPKEKVINKIPMGDKHMIVTFENLSLAEKQHCDNTLDRKGKPID